MSGVRPWTTPASTSVQGVEILRLAARHQAAQIVEEFVEGVHDEQRQATVGVS